MYLKSVALLGVGAIIGAVGTFSFLYRPIGEIAHGLSLAVFPDQVAALVDLQNGEFDSAQRYLYVFSARSLVAELDRAGGTLQMIDVHQMRSFKAFCAVHAAWKGPELSESSKAKLTNACKQ